MARSGGGLVLLACAILLATAAASGAAAATPQGSGVARAHRSLLGEHNHRYKAGEEVPLYANKVGPFHNPRCVLSVAVRRCVCGARGEMLRAKHKSRPTISLSSDTESARFN